MVNVGILGDMDCGKTSVFVRFMNSLANSNEKILTGAPGGPEMYTTQTVSCVIRNWRPYYPYNRLLQSLCLT
ncbi:MAG: hypothetical protein ACW98W_07850 [Candidatus Hodarchaeales archaeon]|jgi:hypothetical protein